MPRSPYFDYTRDAEYWFIPNLVVVRKDRWDYWSCIVRVWKDKSGFIYKAESIWDSNLHWEAQ